MRSVFHRRVERPGAGGSRTVGCVALTLLLGACGKGEERRAAPPAGRPAAIVGGEPVPADWVRVAATSEGLDLEDALGRAVEVAAMGRLARDRGMDRLASVASEGRSALVRILLARQAELADPPTERDRADLLRAYQEHETWFVHPEIRTVEHLAIILDETGGRGTRPRGLVLDPAAESEDAREVLAGFLPLAQGAETPESFAALRPVLEQRWRERWRAAGRADGALPRVAEERIGPFDRQGGYDPAFLATAFALASEGATSEPVRTAYGWHLLYLREVTPARSVPFDEAIPELLVKAKTAIETQRAVGIVREASGRLGVQVHPELLSLTQRGGAEAGPH
ncbi:MAG: peptidyl-prolyl cis-trans isomerase [Deltaproteobacteria bacterium]|nr:peptidyl-prolyl cis-trans isomerase [Deltaproteobacteria bacterium]